MYINRIIQKQIIISIFSFVLVGFVVLGTSTAFFRITVGTESRIEKTGLLNVNFTNGNMVNITSDPMDDVEAMLRTDNIYAINVGNIGSSGAVPYSFNIYIVNNGSSSDMDMRFVRYCIVTDSDIIDSTTCNPKTLSSTPMFKNRLVLSKNNLGPSSSISYKIKIWIFKGDGGELIPNDVIGANLKLKINVCGQAGTSTDGLTAC